VRPGVGKPSALRFGAIFGSAVVVGQVGQLVWLASGSRTMSARAFGTVLAAQSLYTLLQILVDSGTGLHGARLAAAGALDDRTRGSVVRLRLQLALVAGAVAMAVGAAGGLRSVVATAPFAVALVLFGLLNYWESFGHGESRPWSAYIVLRTGAPAAVASLLLVLGRAFPTFLVGLVECVTIACVASAFRLQPVRDLARALRVRHAPRRTAMDIGLPFFLTQISLTAGTVMLNAWGSAAAAGALAVAIRLLTGVNGFSVILVSALFPSLARAHGQESAPSDDRRAIRLAIDIVGLATAAALTLFLARTGFFVRLLLNRPSGAAQATAILLLGSAAAGGIALLLTMVLVARRLENIVPAVYAAATVLTVGASGAILLFGAGKPELALAVPVLVGQLLTVVVLAVRAAERLPAAAGSLARGVAAAFALAAVGLVGAVWPASRGPLALASAAATLVFAILIVADRRRSDVPS
jgi:O-antigen/teichoic acid export membrane protein